MQVDRFLHDLAVTPVAADATNQYAILGPPGNLTRRTNLRLALSEALDHRPDLLLIGEAPGYNGARRTGVPFTSERILLTGLPTLEQFGAQRGYRRATDDGRCSAEQTATLVYREMVSLGLYLVGWNAYPFHPHRLGIHTSNRTPRSVELREGLSFLARFIGFFPRVPVFAMGTCASRSLDTLEIKHVRLRHPAQGGARLFAAGLRDALAFQVGAQRAVDEVETTV
jgi:uracil-DNA glycosylase